ncbi:MAG: penicillin amidase [Alteromonadaceae bacterium]|jgi:penicillin amidase
MLPFYRNRPIAFRFLILFIALMLPVLLYLGSQLSVGLGDSNQVIQVPSTAAAVKINRDPAGVPHIVSNSVADGFFSLGVAHAQDRLWQMEMQRRTSAGRLSEILGYSALDADKLARTLGLYKRSESDLQSLSGLAKKVLQSYTDGVNYWLSQGSVLPVEFSLLGTKPEPWRVQDSLSIIKLFALSQDNRFVDDFSRLLLAQHVGASRTAKLLKTQLPAIFNDTGMSYSAIGDLDQLLQLQKVFTFGQVGTGGSALVLSGDKSQSGAPVMTADAYNTTSQPSDFYVAHINTGEHILAGATIPGVPVIVHGNNQHISWFGVSAELDTQDIYIEAVNLADPNQYKVGGSFKAFDSQTEFISVRSAFPQFLREPLPPFEWQVRRTVHGPLISDVISGLNMPISLSWPALAGSDSSFEAMLSINLSSNWDDFQRSAALLVAPATDYLYADKSGNIGKLVAGKALTKQGEGGKYPLLGWMQNNQQMNSDAPTESLAILNPESGWLSAGLYHPETFVQVTDKLGLADMSRVQQGTTEQLIAQFMPHLLKARATSAIETQAIELLRQWQFDATPVEGAEIALFGAWLRYVKEELSSQLLNQTQPSSAYLKNWLQQMPASFWLHAIELGEFGGCGMADEKPHTRCVNVVTRAFERAVAQLSDRSGDDILDWRWASLSSAVYEHSVFANVNVLDFFFNRNMQAQNTTLMLGRGYEVHSSRFGYQQKTIAGFRYAIDFAKLDQIRATVSTGQSGNIFSPFYHNQLALDEQSPLRLGSLSSTSVKE